MTIRSTLKKSSFGLSLAAVAALAAACGSSHSSGSDTASSAPAQAAPSQSAAATPGTTGASAGTVELKSMSGPLGTFLTDGSGKTLYDFGSDTATMSSCNGACAKAWPPLTAANGMPKAVSGLDASKITTFKRSDGTMQVAYNGHPLYYFVQDTKAGDTNGQGSSAFGAPWYVVSPGGASITKAAPAAGSGTSSSGSGSDAGGGWS